MDEYYQSEEFQALIERYKISLAANELVYFETDEWSDIIQYLATSGRNDLALHAADEALEMYPGAVAPLAFKARYALTVDGNVEQAERYAEMVVDKTDCEYDYLIAEIMIYKEQIEQMDHYLLNRFREQVPEEQDDFALDVAEMLNDYHLTELTLAWLGLVKDKEMIDYKTIKAKALVYSTTRDYDGEGEQLLEQLTHDDPYNVKNWLMLAEAQLVKEEYPTCLDSCDYAIAITPKSMAAIMIKARALHALGRDAEMVNLLQHSQQVCDGEDGEVVGVALAFGLLLIDREHEAYTMIDRLLCNTNDKLSLFSTALMVTDGESASKKIYPLIKHLFSGLDKENEYFWAHMALLSLGAGEIDDYQYYLKEAIRRNPEEAQALLEAFFPKDSKMEDWPILIPKEPTHG